MSTIVDEEKIKQFEQYLLAGDKKEETVNKYIRDVRKLQKYLNGAAVTHESVEGYIAWLKQSPGISCVVLILLLLLWMLFSSFLAGMSILFLLFR